MTIHNPRGISLTAEDRRDGWRICFLEELRKAVPQDAQFYFGPENKWCLPIGVCPPIREADVKATTFRTKTPPPEADDLEQLVRFLS